MAVKEKEKEKGPAYKAPSTTTKVQMVPLNKIKHNTAQSRGMGVLSVLQGMGYGLFYPIKGHEEKLPIWEMLNSDKPEIKKEAIKLIEENEPAIAEFGNKLLATGQLQPVGLRVLDGGLDVIFGMRRTLASMYNRARLGDKAPDKIEAKVFEGTVTAIDLKLTALSENDDREDQSAIDKALTYKWLEKEGKLSPKEIGDRIKCSDQYVRNYTKLLDPLLEDKREEIHAGLMSVDRALKLLQKRKNKGKDVQDSRTPAKDDERKRLPGVKGIIKLYESERKPEDMSDEEWSYWIDPTVRKFLAFKLGLEYKEYTPPVEGEEKEKKGEEGKEESKEEGKQETNGTTPTPSKVMKLKRSLAVKLLIALGKTSAKTWDDATIQSKLENIVNIVEDGQKVETTALQGVLDKLVAGYKEGIKVKITEDGKEAKK